MHQKITAILVTVLSCAWLFIGVGCSSGGGSGGSSGLAAVVQGPVANADSANTVEDVAVEIDVIANDLAGDSATLSVSAVGVGNAGQTSILADGRIRFVPNANFNGTDTFSYTVTDGNAESATAQVTVVVSPENDPPVANDDTLAAVEDTTSTVDVLANDTDIEQSALTVVTIGAPANGMVSMLAPGVLEYQPNPDFCGSDQFNYTIEDSEGASSTATVVIGVSCNNDQPVLGDDFFAVAFSSVVELDVLANDVDIDGDTLEVVAVTQPAQGQVEITITGAVQLSDLNVIGTFDFEYTVSDGEGGLVSATVIFEVVQGGYSGANITVNYEVLDGTASWLLPLSLELPGEEVEACQMTLLYDSALCSVIQVDIGQDLALVQGGAGPDVFDVVFGGGDIQIAMVVDNLGLEQMLIADVDEIAVVKFDSVAEQLLGNALGVSTHVNWGDSVDNRVTVGGLSLAVSLVSSEISFVPNLTGAGFHLFAPSSVVVVPSATGSAQFFQQILLVEGGLPSPSAAALTNGFSLGLAFDVDLVDPVAATPGAAMQLLGGGSGPDFFASTIEPGGVSIGVVYSFVGAQSLSFAAVEEIVVVELQTQSAALQGSLGQLVVDMNFVDTLGIPAIENIVVVNGFSEFPSLSAGRIVLQLQ